MNNNPNLVSVHGGNPRLAGTLIVVIIVLIVFVICFGVYATRNTPSPPPGYQLQTDGYHWRFIGIERRTGFFTNENNDGTRSGCVREAWKIFKSNRQPSEWKNHE